MFEITLQGNFYCADLIIEKKNYNKEFKLFFFKNGHFSLKEQQFDNV